MRAVVQRVSSAAVHVDGAEIASIGPGLLILLGVETGDDEPQAAALATKIAKLRIFPDDAKPMNRSVLDTGGHALVVSQFTLAAELAKGNRPSFTTAAEPVLGEALYRHFVTRLTHAGVSVQTGRFGAMMDVSLVNAGPATFVLEVPAGETRVR